MERTRGFVIQEHARGDSVHWDLMLERGEALQTYRLELPPDKLLEQSCTAVRIFDHPLKFLTYEGVVNDGEGSVRIADSGTYRLLSENEDCFGLQLTGEILKGEFALVRIEGGRWEFGRR